MTEPHFNRDDTNWTSDTYNFYSRLHFDAATTQRYLVESWRRTQRHNRAIERAALWCALQLDADCRVAVAGDVLSALPTEAGVQTRYEVHAGVRTVYATMPLTIAERQALAPDILDNPRFTNISTMRAPELVERWHEWLWSDDTGTQQTSIEALGSSAIYAEGCVRLTGALPTLLGWPATNSGRP
jgi:hypothetical protein